MKRPEIEDYQGLNPKAGDQYTYDWCNFSKDQDIYINYLKDFITGFDWETHGNYTWASGEVTDEQKQILDL